MRKLCGRTIGAALAAAAALLAMAAVATAGQVTLRPAITVDKELVTLGDLFANLDGEAAVTPVFRAPDPGQSGVVSAARVAAAARDHGVVWRNKGLFAQVTVTSASTVVTIETIRAAIEQAVRARLGARHDANLAVALDDASRALHLSPSASGAMRVARLSHNPHSGAFTAHLVADNDANRTYTYSGTASELVQVPVLQRAIAHGERIAAGDVAMTAMAKSRVPDGVEISVAAIVGMAARRGLAANQTVRPDDLIEVVRVPVLTRAIAHGERITADDLVMTGLAKNLIPVGIEMNIASIAGMGARRGLLANQTVRPDDLVEMVQVPVLARPVIRGEQITARDVIMAPMARNRVPLGVEMNAASIVGMAARRGLLASQTVRSEDLEQPRVITRNRLVTVVYQAKGLTLSTRGRTLEDGAKGDVVRVMNIRSKRIIETVVVASDKVAVVGIETPVFTASIAGAAGQEQQRP